MKKEDQLKQKLVKDSFDFIVQFLLAISIFIIIMGIPYFLFIK